jgi:hypothetical protein
MKLPDFKTEEEELKFWEKHSISPYLDRPINWYYCKALPVIPLHIEEQK